MFCDNCGNKLREGAKFCPKCGSSVFANTDGTREQQQLTPDISGIDESKPIHERIKDIDKPVFTNDDDTKTEKPKKGKKKLIITISVVLCCALIGGIIAFFATRPITLDKAYDEYIEELKNENEGAKKDIDNVVLYDVNNSGIPDLIYSKDNYIRLFYDRNVAVGQLYKDNSQSSRHTTIFKSNVDNNLYFFSFEAYSNDYLICDFFCIDEKDKNSLSYTLNYKPIGFHVSYSKADSDIFHITEYDDEDRQENKKYKNFIKKMQSGKITIIYTNATKEYNELILGRIDETLPSMKYKQAIEALEKRKIPNYNSSANVQTESAKKDDETKTEYFKMFAGEYTFTSGAGAWSTQIEIKDDGTFTGKYQDTDAGYRGKGYEATLYLSEFSGKFINPKKINDYKYSFELSELKYKNTPGTEEITDPYGQGVNMLVKYSDAYGLNNNTKTIYAYTESAPISKLPEGLLSWVDILRDEDAKNSSILSYKCLYAVEPKYGWIKK